MKGVQVGQQVRRGAKSLRSGISFLPFSAAAYNSHTKLVIDAKERSQNSMGFTFTHEIFKDISNSL